ncbi:MAG: hypothetical protein ACM31C_07430 [Acidobacteriota bacterium]
MRTLLLLAMLATTAAADPSRTPDVRAMHTDDCAKARKQHKPCIIDMGKAEEVNGKTVLPKGTDVVAIGTGKEPSLVHIRRELIVQILKSAEDL